MTKLRINRVYPPFWAGLPAGDGIPDKCSSLKILIANFSRSHWPAICALPNPAISQLGCPKGSHSFDSQITRSWLVISVSREIGGRFRTSKKYLYAWSELLSEIRAKLYGSSFVFSKTRSAICAVWSISLFGGDL